MSIVSQGKPTRAITHREHIEGEQVPTWDWPARRAALTGEFFFMGSFSAFKAVTKPLRPIEMHAKPTGSQPVSLSILPRDHPAAWERSHGFYTEVRPFFPRGTRIFSGRRPERGVGDGSGFKKTGVTRVTGVTCVIRRLVLILAANRQTRRRKRRSRTKKINIKKVRSNQPNAAPTTYRKAPPASGRGESRPLHRGLGSPLQV